MMLSRHCFFYLATVYKHDWVCIMWGWILQENEIPYCGNRLDRAKMMLHEQPFKVAPLPRWSKVELHRTGKKARTDNL